MAQQLKTSAIDWTDCQLVEVNPGKLSGVPILKGTRVQADSILENFEGGETVEDISDNFDVSEETIRTVLAYALNKRNNSGREDPVRS